MRCIMQLHQIQAFAFFTFSLTDYTAYITYAYETTNFHLAISQPCQPQPSNEVFQI